MLNLFGVFNRTEHGRVNRIDESLPETVRDEDGDEQPLNFLRDLLSRLKDDIESRTRPVKRTFRI